MGGSGGGFRGAIQLGSKIIKKSDSGDSGGFGVVDGVDGGGTAGRVIPVSVLMGRGAPAKEDDDGGDGFEENEFEIDEEDNEVGKEENRKNSPSTTPGGSPKPGRGGTGKGLLGMLGIGGDDTTPRTGREEGGGGGGDDDDNIPHHQEDGDEEGGKQGNASRGMRGGGGDRR